MGVEQYCGARILNSLLKALFHLRIGIRKTLSDDPE